MAPTLNLGPDELLTTRAVRRRLDLERPVDRAVIKECLQIAQQAPSGSNTQGWHWIVVDEPDQRARVAALYRHPFNEYRVTASRPGSLFASTMDSSARTQQHRAGSSVACLAENLHRVPVLLITAIRAPGSAVLPTPTRPHSRAR